MMVKIQVSKLRGMITAPASKSSMQRALAAAFLSRRPCLLNNPGHSADDKASMEIIQSMGAVIRKKDDSLLIEPSNNGPVDEVNCGESGLAIRMFTPILALGNQPVIIKGEGSLQNRPMDLFEEIFPALGVKIESNEGKLPLRVQGPLKPANIEIDGSLSSQFLTGLLLAFAAAGAKNQSIKVRNLKSRPYIDLTLDVIRKFRLASIENLGYRSFVFNGSLPAEDSYTYTVEADWSGGAFLLVAGALAGPIMVNGLDLGSTQADRAIVDALMDAHAGIAMEAKGIRIHPSSLKAFHFDASDCPDLFPPLVALAANCSGTTIITGAGRLIHKESNRAIALKEEFGKMGIRIELAGDEMRIEGCKLVGAKVHSHHDHRIAMALAIAALKAEGTTSIEAAEAVSKSYPDFFNDLEKLGADVSLDNKIKWHE